MHEVKVEVMVGLGPQNIESHSKSTNYVVSKFGYGPPDDAQLYESDVTGARAPVYKLKVARFGAPVLRWFRYEMVIAG